MTKSLQSHNDFSQETVKVLARFPYLRPEDSTSEQKQEVHRTTAPSFLTFLTDPLRRAVALGVAVLFLLGLVWFFASGTKEKEVASSGSHEAWAPPVPRPDAPDAPLWTPSPEALSPGSIQATQAQPFGSEDSSPAAVKSPLGFDLPPGNGWGYPPDAAASAVVGDQASLGKLPGQPILSWEQSPAAPSPSYSGPGQMAPPPATSAVQLTSSATPWANAAGFAPAESTPAGAYGASQVFSSPAQSVAGTSGATQTPAGVLRNPYYNPAPSGDAATTYPQTNSSAAALSLGNSSWGNQAPVASPGGWPAPVELQPPSNANLSASATVIASRPAYPQSQQGNLSGNPAAGAPSAGYPSAGYATAAPSYGTSPAKTTLPGATGDVANPWSVPAGQPLMQGVAVPPSGANLPAAVPSSDGFHPAWPAYQAPAYPTRPMIPQAPSYSATGAGVWGNPPPATQWGNGPASQQQETPVYPGTDSYRSYGTPAQPRNTQPQDSQVVPATYANPAGFGSPSAYPPRVPSTPRTQGSASGGELYPSTGQTGYNLYPTSTLR